MFTGDDVTAELKDDIISKMVNAIDCARATGSKHLEMEIRLGRFTQDHHFQPGYGSMNLANKLIDSLRKNCETKQGWTQVKPLQIITAQYKDDIRKRVIPGYPQEIIRKRKLATIDIGSNREYGFRFAISEELPVQDHHCDRDPPLYLWISERVTFDYISPVDSSIHLRFDISKTSQRGSNKLEACEKKADFHCEVEFIESGASSSLTSFQIANILLSTARETMGNYRKNEEGHLIRIPPAKLFLMK